MTPFTLIMAYYDNPGMLGEHFRFWRHLPREILKSLHVVVVDDGSPRWPAVLACPINYVEIASFQLWRMKVDVPWNQDACRNLGVDKAPTEWVVMTDIDHIVAAETWQRLMLGEIDEDCVYRFGRVTAPMLTPYKHHPNSWAMTRRMFWRAGGYDEALAGNYGTDGDYGRRVAACAPIKQLKEVLIRYPRDVIADASTTTLERKRSEEKDNIRSLIKARNRVPDWRPRVLSFPHERVL